MGHRLFKRIRLELAQKDMRRLANSRPAFTDQGSAIHLLAPDSFFTRRGEKRTCKSNNLWNS
jgi:hypothetical protein